MTRRDTGPVHGFVQFPTEANGYRDTREGGLVVFAVWWTNKNVVCSQGLVIGLTGPVVSHGYVKQEEANNQATLGDCLRLAKLDEERRSTDRVLLPTIEESHPSMVQFDGKYVINYEWHQGLNLSVRAHAALDFLKYESMLGHPYRSVEGIVYLGSSQGSWRDTADSEYFTPTMKQLTSDGITLIEQLNKLYGSHPQLITVLDT